MNDQAAASSQYTIRYSCPTQQHMIELMCEPSTVVTVPQSCPTCGTGLPDAYRIKLREIMNVTRFQAETQAGMDHDIEIEIA